MTPTLITGQDVTAAPARAPGGDDPGPGDAHCTERQLHDYSCFDAGKDLSWNDRQFADGGYDATPHACDEPDCAGR